jgi:hypothetical protein
MGAWLSWQVAQGVIRGALTSLGGTLVAGGVLTGQQSSDLIGALMIILGIVWSVVANRGHAVNKAVVEAVAKNPSVTVILAAQTATNKPVVVVRPRVDDLPPKSLTAS